VPARLKAKRLLLLELLLLRLTIVQLLITPRVADEPALAARSKRKHLLVSDSFCSLFLVKLILLRHQLLLVKLALQRKLLMLGKLLLLQLILMQLMITPLRIVQPTLLLQKAHARAARSKTKTVAARKSANRVTA
jgi:hypothetical protein